MNKNTFSVIHKKHISESLAGVSKSEEHKKNIGNALRGVPKSEEHKKSISRSLIEHWMKKRREKEQRILKQVTE